MPNVLRPTRDKLFDWILSLRSRAKYNFTSSGLSEPDLRAMGVDTSFEHFAAEKDELEKVFAEGVARLYDVEPENVLPTAGSSEAIFLVYSVLGAGGRTVVPLPNYPPMLTVPEALGMKVARSLKSARTRGTLIGLTDPNNPTGQSLDSPTMDALIRSSGEATIYINETYREFTFPPRAETHFGQASNIVISNTMTKFYGLGRLRVGWILADEKRAGRLLYGKWAVSGHDSDYSMWIATQVLKKREKFVERARKIYSTNARLVRKFLAQTKGISTELGPAPFCLVRYTKGPGSVSMATRLLEEKAVLVSPGDFFGAPKSFRLCFTTDEATLKPGLDALADFLG